MLVLSVFRFSDSASLTLRISNSRFTLTSNQIFQTFLSPNLLETTSFDLLLFSYDLFQSYLSPQTLHITSFYLQFSLNFPLLSPVNFMLSHFSFLLPPYDGFLAQPYQTVQQLLVCFDFDSNPYISSLHISYPLVWSSVPF